jgi:hypothetical protein
MSIIERLWKEQPGRYFCISTKSATGDWGDHFFTRSKFGEIKKFVEDNQDKDIYFCPHGFIKPRRLKRFAEPPKMLWADLDEADPRDFDESLLPTVAIESSPGRFVGLWLTSDFTTEELNRRLTYHLEADKGGWDWTQVLRYPGTKNYKYEHTPRVKILWSDGPKYAPDEITKLLPKEGAKPGSATDARAIYKKYERKFSGFVRRELLRGKPRVGKRSEVFWRLVNDILEAGVTEDEAFELLRASPWNKFKKRRDGDEQLRRELDKAIGGHFAVYDDSAGETKPQTYDDSDDEDYDDRAPRLNVQNLAKVESVNMDWIWYPYLARGEVTILEGDPGLGKSYLAQMAALAVCDGKALPSVKKRPTVQGKVMYFDIENAADSITKRRLEYNSCEHMENYYQVEEAFSIDDEDYLDLVYEAMEQIKPVLVVFDTLNTYMGGADTHKASETQQVFKEFRLLARRFNASVLVLRHLTKGQKGRSAIYAGQGSIAFAGLARVVMTCGHHPDPDNTDERLMAVTKINVARAPRALSFSIDPLPDLLNDEDRSRFVWGEFVDFTADQIVNTDRATSDKVSEKSQEVIDFLKEFLGNGAMDSRAVRQAAEARSFTTRTLNRVVADIGIVKETRRNGKRRQVFWAMPDILVED